jgi:tetratricopeptide (TPR) repeat protein
VTKQRQGAAWYAWAKAMSGDLAGANALIATTPLDCDTCVRMRGKIAALEHDWADAERWFTQETRQAPSIPYAYVDWAAERLARGDVDGAIAKLVTAHQKGPHYADALELWGEALMKKGDYKGAAAKFQEAAKYAPNWTKNQQLLKQAQAHG